MLEFDCDDNKARTNLEKHSISFDESKSVFFDDFARTKPDPDHSIGEER
jgi:uncharacterized protein